MDLIRLAAVAVVVGVCVIIAVYMGVHKLYQVVKRLSHHED